MSSRPRGLARDPRARKNTGPRVVVGERLAIGGMAEVFLGQLMDADGASHDVVVKRMLPNLATDPVMVKRFIAEAELAAQLTHDNIIRVIELVVDDDLMMVMEAIDGADLATVIKRSRLRETPVPLPIALRIIHDVASALAYAHDKRDAHGEPLCIIHRDVTPSNILIGRDGATKLIDFGIARAASLEHLTQSGYLVGKLHYLAPEQIRHEAYDHRVDVWAAGVVLFQLLSGQRPFDGRSEPAVLMQVAMGERPDIRSLTKIPSALADVVDRALSVEVAERFASAAEFVAALDDVIAVHGPAAGRRELGALVDELVPRPEDATVTDAARGSPRSARSLIFDEDDDDAVLVQRPEATLIVSELSPENAQNALTALPRQATTDVTRTMAAASRPSVGPPAVRTVSTRDTVPRPRDLPPRPRRRRPIPVFAAAAFMAVGALAATVVAVLVDDDPPAVSVQPIAAEILPPPPRTATPPLRTPPTTVTPVAIPTPVPTPVPVPVPATPAAAPTTTPTPDPSPPALIDKKGPRRPPRVVAKEAPGEIVVDSRPWSRVSLDGAPAGVTPTVLRGVRPGRHTLLLENDEQGLKKTVTVVVASEETATVRVDLKR